MGWFGLKSWTSPSGFSRKEREEEILDGGWDLCRACRLRDLIPQAFQGIPFFFHGFRRVQGASGRVDQREAFGRGLVAGVIQGGGFAWSGGAVHAIEAVWIVLQQLRRAALRQDGSLMEKN